MAELEKTAWDLPEGTALEVIDKISAFASEIRSDWTDPRGECREIWRLCTLLKSLLPAE